MSLHLLRVLAETYLKNPFFLLPQSTSPTQEVAPLLHQTELVARTLLINPLRVLVADVIGLGKTVEALRLVYALEKYSGKPLRTLVIVPSTLEKQWEQEIRRFGYEPVKLTHENLERLRRGELASGLFLGRMDTLKKEEYFPKLTEVEWDVIVVDEAHKIEKPEIHRYNYIELAKMHRKASVILLSATPHRGKDKYYLALLSALDPDLAPLVQLRHRSDSPIVDADFYSRTHNVLVFRRTKKDVNTIYEQREVFKRAVMLNVLLKPNELELKVLDGLVSIGREMLKTYYSMKLEMGERSLARVRGLPNLLTLLLVKRGASSPRALVNTFSSMSAKRIDDTPEGADESLEELVKQVKASIDPDKAGELEEEPDKTYNKLANALYRSGLISGKSQQLLTEYLRIANSMVRCDHPDTKVEFIAGLVEAATGERGPLPSVLSDLLGAKILVFTEFKDTAEYIRSKLVSRLKAKYPSAENMVRVLTSENKDEFKDVQAWLSKPGVKVLVATDVMSEGLNLQEANVLVNYEVVYSPVKLEQRIGRVWRYGQKRTVYVFNIFFLHPRIRKIHEIFFAKVYAINETLGKQEAIPGDNIYIVSLQNTIFDKMLERELGEQGREVARFIESVGYGKATRALKGSEEVEETGENIEETATLSMVEDDDKEYEKRLDVLASEVVRELLEVARIAQLRRLYPEQTSREDVERLLEAVWGIRNSDEAGRLSQLVFDMYSKLTGDINKPKSPVDKLHYVLNRTPSEPLSKPLYFVTSLSSTILVLYRVPLAIGDRVISDLVLVKLNLSSGRAETFRGLKLVEQLSSVLENSLEIDEVYGEIPAVTNALPACSMLAKESIRVEKVLDRVREYEEAKRKLVENRAGHPCEGVYTVRAEFGEPELLAVFFSPDVLPRSSYQPSTGVWGEFEKKYLTEIVLAFEKQAGRQPVLVHLEEHYDVYSVGRDGEERFIECKGFTEPRVEFRLKEMQYWTARELGDKYWVYLVYGVGTNTPVVLAIRNPAHRLDLKPEVYEVREVRFRFSMR